MQFSKKRVGRNLNQAKSAAEGFITVLDAVMEQAGMSAGQQNQSAKSRSSSRKSGQGSTDFIPTTSAESPASLAAPQSSEPMGILTYVAPLSVLKAHQKQINKSTNGTAKVWTNPIDASS